MSDLKSLSIPVKDPITHEITQQTFGIAGDASNAYKTTDTVGEVDDDESIMIPVYNSTQHEKMNLEDDTFLEWVRVKIFASSNLLVSNNRLYVRS